MSAKDWRADVTKGIWQTCSQDTAGCRGHRRANFRATRQVFLGGHHRDQSVSGTDLGGELRLVLVRQLGVKACRNDAEGDGATQAREGAG